MKHCFIFIISFTALLANAMPVTPSRDDQVLQVLPTRLMPSSERIALLNANAAWRAAPLDLDAINTLARLYIEQTRETTDPRYLGYALALLSPWANKADVPMSIRFIRATIAQRNHQFDVALNELSLILKQDPNQSEAWLMRATIEQVQGNYAAARNSCSKLYDFAALMVGMVCTAQVDGLSGKAQQAYQRLDALLNLRQAGLTTDIRQWMLLTQIDLAQRLGREDQIAAGFKTLLAAEKVSPETKAAYTDWLLSRRRYQEVINFAAQDIRDDGLLLRLAIAESALNNPSAKNHIDLLKDRYAAGHLRGDRVHLREEARFTLELLKQPKAALALAEANWKVQREPADARILLAAALAAGEPEKALPVKNWLQQSGIQEASLRQQALALRGIKS